MLSLWDIERFSEKLKSVGVIDLHSLHLVSDGSKLIMHWKRMIEFHTGGGEVDINNALSNFCFPTSPEILKNFS